jgi:hypothetical protein
MMRFLEALNKPAVVLALLLVMLSTFGFLYYRYEPANDTPPGQAPGASTSEATVPETTARPQYEGGNTTPVRSTTSALEADEAVFVHRATSENIVDNSTYLDHPLANGNPNAFILVTQISKPDSDVANNDHPVGVWYDANRSGRWAIFNQDLAVMSEGAAFNVAILEGPGNVVHRVAPANTVANSTYIDHPLANGNPDAVLTVTANWNPEGGAGAYNDHPVSVGYDVSREKWAVSNRDLVPMPARVAFNVAISESTER